MTKTALPFLFSLVLLIKYGQTQESYNDCSNALELCPNTVFTANNIAANITFCPGCEDDFNFCFIPQNTIWFTFKTNNIGGDVIVSFSNLNFSINPSQDNQIQSVILEAPIPCNSGSYNEISNCVSDGSNAFNLTALSLLPNTTYYIVVNGDNTGPGILLAAECTFDLSISGAGVDRPTPAISLMSSSNSICLNDLVLFEATLTDCPDSSSYHWFINNQLVAITDSNFFSTSELIDGDILTVENNCFSTCVEVVTANNPIIQVYSFNLDAGLDQTINLGSTVSLNATTSAPIYTWEPAFLFSNPLILNPTVFVEETTTISLIATENGCTLIDYLTINVSSDLFIPNMFSPNGDNINECWVIEGIEDYPNNSVNVYDRWGQEVFSSTSYSTTKAWDGTIKNKTLAEGVFYYVLNLNDKENTQHKGSVTIIR